MNVSRRGFLAFMATTVATAATAPVIAALPAAALAEPRGVPAIVFGLCAHDVAPGARVTVTAITNRDVTLRELHVSSTSSPYFAIVGMPSQELYGPGERIEMVVCNQSSEPRSFFAAW